MVWSVVQSYVPWLAGPLALAVAIWTFFRQLQQVQKTQAEVDNIKGRLGPDIMKTVEEARKLHQESTKIPMEVERIRAEIRKLTEEIRQLKASAIAAEISTNRTRIAADQIVKCIDEIRDRAKESHLAAEDAYEVLFRENPTERDVKDALQKRILPFVNRYKERGPLQGNLAELEALIKPLEFTAVDLLIPTIWQFLTIVSFSRQSQADFVGMIQRSNYRPKAEEVDTIKMWLQTLRASYEDVEKALSQIAAHVGLSARDGL